MKNILRPVWAIPLAVAAALATEPTVGARLQSRHLTLYQDGFAFAQDLYQLSSSQQRYRALFQPIPSAADPATVRVEIPKGTVLWTRFRAGAPTGEELLGQLRGHTLRFISPDGQQVIEGTLLQLLPPYALLRTPAGMLLLPSPTQYRVLITGDSLPAAVPVSLEVLVHLEQPRDVPATVSYLLDGIGWRMRYRLRLPPQGTTAILCGTALIENQSEATYDSVTVSLVAGTVPRLRLPRTKVWEPAAMMARESAAEVPTAEKLSGFYRYELPDPIRLRPHEHLQLPLIACTPVSTERFYRIESSAAAYGHLPVVEFLRIANTEGAGLGVPLPAGTAHVVMPSPEREEFVAETAFPELPVGDTVTLALGTAFDLKARQLLLGQRDLGDNLREETYQLTLLNGGQEAASVEISFQLRWDQHNWRVSSSTHPYFRIDAQTLGFRLSVPARGESVLRFTVQSQRPPR